MEDQSMLIQASASPAQTFAGKIKNPALIENVFFFTRTWAWNIYKFIFVWILNEMSFYKISDYAEQAEQKSLYKPWLWIPWMPEVFSLTSGEERQSE